MFSKTSLNPNDRKNDSWLKVDNFVKVNGQDLAALVWGLFLEWDKSNDILGIDLKPKPHFVRCSRQAIEELNENVNCNLQEVLGILDGLKREEEVAAIAIGSGQIKLINFQPELPPPLCFEQATATLDQLIEQLEENLSNLFTITSRESGSPL